MDWYDGRGCWTLKDSSYRGGAALASLEEKVVSVISSVAEAWPWTGNMLTSPRVHVPTNIPFTIFVVLPFSRLVEAYLHLSIDSFHKAAFACLTSIIAGSSTRGRPSISSSLWSVFLHVAVEGSKTLRTGG